MGSCGRVGVGTVRTPNTHSVGTRHTPTRSDTGRLLRAEVVRRGARIRVVPGENEGAGPDLGQAAGAAGGFRLLRRHFLDLLRKVRNPLHLLVAHGCSSAWFDIQFLLWR